MTDPPDVLVGRDRHLFEARRGTLEQITGARSLPPAQAQAWAGAMAAHAAACGGRDWLLIAPEKHVVYAEALPDGLTPARTRPALRLLRALPPDLRARALYPAAALRAARARGETYYRTDPHWTGFGAYIAYRALLATLRRTGGPNLRPLRALAGAHDRKVGELGMRMTPEWAETALVVTPAGPPARRLAANLVFDVGQVDVFAGDPAGPTAVLFRDSSGSAMLPFLAPHFRRLVALASTALHPDLLNAERPDVVITQTTERALHPAGPPPMPLPGLPATRDFRRLTGLSLPLPGSSAPQ